MKEITEQSLSKARETIEYFNKASINIKAHLRDNIKHDLNNLYMSYDKENDRFELNDRLPKLELYNYMVNMEIYKNGLSVAKSYEESGIETTKYKYQKVTQNLEFSAKKPNFKDLFLKYADLMKNCPFSPSIMTME